MIIYNLLFEFRENMWWTCYRIRTSTCTAILHTNSTPDPDSAVTMLTSKTSSLQYLNTSLRSEKKCRNVRKCRLSFGLKFYGMSLPSISLLRAFFYDITVAFKNKNGQTFLRLLGYIQILSQDLKRTKPNQPFTTRAST